MTVAMAMATIMMTVATAKYSIRVSAVTDVFAFVPGVLVLEGVAAAALTTMPVSEADA